MNKLVLTFSTILAFSFAASALASPAAMPAEKGMPSDAKGEMVQEHQEIKVEHEEMMKEPQEEATKAQPHNKKKKKTEKKHKKAVLKSKREHNEKKIEQIVQPQDGLNGVQQHEQAAPEASK